MSYPRHMIADNSTGIANLFAKFFSDAFSDTNHLINPSLLFYNNINLNSSFNLNTITLIELDVYNMI